MLNLKQVSLTSGDLRCSIKIIKGYPPCWVPESKRTTVKLLDTLGPTQFVTDTFGPVAVGQKLVVPPAVHIPSMTLVLLGCSPNHFLMK